MQEQICHDCSSNLLAFMQSIFRHNYPKNIAIILCIHFKQEDNPALFSLSHHKNISLFSTRKTFVIVNDI